MAEKERDDPSDRNQPVGDKKYDKGLPENEALKKYEGCSDEETGEGFENENRPLRPSFRPRRPHGSKLHPLDHIGGSQILFLLEATDLASGGSAACAVGIAMILMPSVFQTAAWQRNGLRILVADGAAGITYAGRSRCDAKGTRQKGRDDDPRWDAQSTGQVLRHFHDVMLLSTKYLEGRQGKS